jgi:hypothetical protein
MGKLDRSEKTCCNAGNDCTDKIENAELPLIFVFWSESCPTVSNCSQRHWQLCLFYHLRFKVPSWHRIAESENRQSMLPLPIFNLLKTPRSLPPTKTRRPFTPPPPKLSTRTKTDSSNALLMLLIAAALIVGMVAIEIAGAATVARAAAVMSVDRYLDCLAIKTIGPGIDILEGVAAVAKAAALMNSAASAAAQVANAAAPAVNRVTSTIVVQPYAVSTGMIHADADREDADREDADREDAVRADAASAAARFVAATGEAALPTFLMQDTDMHAKTVFR